MLDKILELHLNREAKLLQFAAERGFPEAQIKLGEMYLHGHRVEKDIEKALWYFREAAEPGHQEAQFALGSIYLHGQDVGKDVDEATYWIGTAAQQGHLGALCTVNGGVNLAP